MVDWDLFFGLLANGSVTEPITDLFNRDLKVYDFVAPELKYI